MVPLYRHGGGKGPAVTLVADQTLASVRPSPYPDGTGHVPATGDPQPTRDDTSATIHPVPGSSVFWGESVSAPSVPWFVDLAPTMWARRGRRKEAEPLPAVRALHLPREDLPERPRSHQVTAAVECSRSEAGLRINGAAERAVRDHCFEIVPATAPGKVASAEGTPVELDRRLSIRRRQIGR